MLSSDARALDTALTKLVRDEWSMRAELASKLRLVT